MLPPVTEAISLLDHAFVNHDWQNSPATLRRCVGLLVDHIQVHAVQLSRVEDILAAYGNPTQQGGTVWSKLAAKADLSRLEQLEQQVDNLLNDSSTAKSKQAEVGYRNDELNNRLELLRDGMASLEARLGSAAPTGGNPRLGGAGVGGRLGTASATAFNALAGSGGVGSQYPASPPRLVPGSGSGSAVDRIQRLERRLDNVGDAEACCEVLGRLRELEPRIELQLSHLRGEVKGALATAAASGRAEMEAEAGQRVKEAEKRLVVRLQGVEESFSNNLSALNSRLGGSIAGELDKRFVSVYDHVDFQVSNVRGELDRLSREKVDVGVMDHYTQRMSGLFEQVASSLNENSRALNESLGAAVGEVRTDMAVLQQRDGALHEFVQREVEAMRGIATQVTSMVGVVSESVARTPAALDEARTAMAQLTGEVDDIHKTLSGLQAATSLTGSGLEQQAQRVTALAQRLGQAQHEVRDVKAAVFGTPTSGGITGADAGLPTGSLLLHVSEVNQRLSELAAALSCKADEGGLRDAERRLAALTRQVEGNSEGVRCLSSSTYKRVDEHASAIQRLTLAISSSMEERPTLVSVRGLVEGGAADVRERCESALLPLWEAVKLLQAGLRDCQGSTQGLAGGGRQRGTGAGAEARTRGAGEKSALVGALRRAVDEEMGQLRLSLEGRVEALAEEATAARAQMEVQAQLQDRHGALTTAVEDQLSSAVSGWRSAHATLRSDVGSRVDALTGGVADNVEALAVALNNALAELQERVPGPSSSAAARTSASQRRAPSPSRSPVAWRAWRCRARGERDEMRWRVWMEQYASGQQQAVGREELQGALAACGMQALEDAQSACSASLVDVRAVMRAELDSRLRGSGSKLDSLEARMEGVEVLITAAANQQDLTQLGALLEGKADRGLVEARLRQAAVDSTSAISKATGLCVTHPELEIALSRKVDVRTYLASSSATAAAAAATAAAFAAAPGTSASQQHSRAGSPAEASLRRSAQELTQQPAPGNPSTLPKSSLLDLVGVRWPHQERAAEIRALLPAAQPDGRSGNSMSQVGFEGLGNGRNGSSAAAAVARAVDRLKERRRMDELT
ncbi:MAG: hypothetical protein WDW36_006815 [Sanguina aurantia]